MRNSMLTALMAVLATAQLARGQDLEIGATAPALEGTNWMNLEGDPYSMVELRGLVVVLYFFVSFHGAGEALLPFTNLVENNPSFGKTAGVMIIGVTDAKRDAVERALMENKVLFPVVFESKAAEEYKITVFPSIVIIDPEGKIAYKGAASDINSVRSALTKVLSESPATRMHPAQADFAARRLESAQKELQKNEWRRSFRQARSALQAGAQVVGDPLLREAIDVFDTLELTGSEMLAHVSLLIDKKEYAAAADLVRTVKNKFRGLDCAADAKAMQERLESEHDEFKDAMTKFKDEAAAARILLAAREEIRARRIADANKKIDEILAKYPNSIAAARAQEMRKRMKEFESVLTTIVDQECEKGKEWLAQARNYIAARRFDDAKGMCRKILDECPNSRYARDAEQILIHDIP